MAEQWLREQGISVPRTVDTESDNCQEALAAIGTAYSLCLAFYQAIWELIAAGELFPAASPAHWKPSLEYKTSHGGGGIPHTIGCTYPEKVERPSFVRSASTDPDIFLRGIDCTTLHAGIVEAVEQSLSCFRRGLYMPAMAMLAAAAEATWTECGEKIAAHLTDPKLDAIMKDPYASISKKVTETRKTFEKPSGKALLKAANRTIADVNNAELWTTALRERRNALHWGKVKSFIVDHSDAGTLLMAAPQHIGALEAIRASC
jgi:hypothetical protein